MEQYNLPFHMKSGGEWYTHILPLFGILFFVGFLIFLSVDSLKYGYYIEIEVLLFELIVVIAIISLVHRYVSINILRKYYIEMTTEYLNFYVLYRKERFIHWSEICQAHIYERKGITFINILLEEDRERLTKRTIYNNLNSSLGFKPASFSMPLVGFWDIDAEKLLATIEQQINKNKINNYMDIEIINENNTK